jgi:hypothetical protein
MISGSQMDEGTWSTVLGTFRKAPSLVGANVVTDIKIDSAAQDEYRCFGPFSFFDIEGEESQPTGSGSWVNIEEAELVLLLYRHLVAKYPELKVGSKVTVISPYKQQVS